jgi:O-antigen/teichoic acid export membrane protein
LLASFGPAKNRSAGVVFWFDAMDRTLIKNMLMLASIQGANYIFPLITLPYLVRVLGPADYGRIGFSAAFVQYFVLLTDFGFNLSATRSIATNRSDPAAVNRIFWSVMSSKTIFCVVGALLLLGMTAVVPKLGAERPMLFASYLTVLGSVLFPIWLFQGLERMGLITFSSLAARLAMLPLIFIFVRSPHDAVICAAIQSGTSVVAGLVSLWVVAYQRLIAWARPTRVDIVEAVRESWPLFLSIAAISLYTNSNVVILGFLASKQAVGQFVAVDKIRQVVQALINPMSQTFYPRICSLITDEPQRAYRLIHRALLSQGGLTLAISLGLLVFAGPIVRLGLGPKFIGAVDTLRLLAFLPFAIGVSNVFGIQTMLPLGMRRPFRNIVIGSGVLNLILLVPLVYWFADRGAAASVLVTEYAVTIAMALLIVRHRIPIFFPPKELAVEV